MKYRPVPYDFFWVAVVDGIDVFVERRARFCFDFLDFLQTAARYEEFARLRVVRKNFGELRHNVLEDVWWRVV